MRRRTALRALGFFGFLGLTSGTYFGFKWNLFKNSVDLNSLDQYKPTLKSLVDLIIPETSTPSASQSKVEEFVLLMIRDCADKRTQINFLEGLKELSEKSINEFGTNFERCTQKEKIQLFNHFYEEGKPLPGIIGKAKNKFVGLSFFTSLKKYTSIGYCTSKKGATQALAYVAIPTRHEPCVDLSKYPKSWATE